MWTQDEIKAYLKNNLKESRYKHTLGVVETAIRLSDIYNCSKEKAIYAALIHDVAKYENDERLIAICTGNGYKISTIEKKSPYLLHGLAGSIIAKEKMGINDEDILNAAIYHTTGRENMTLLEKIIYIADCIEPNRVFPGVEELRIITFDNLDDGILRSLDDNIKFIIDRGLLLHENTIKARNYLIDFK